MTAPISEAELNELGSLVREHGALAKTPALRLIAELRALREATRPLISAYDNSTTLHSESGRLSMGISHATMVPTVVWSSFDLDDLRRLRDLVPKDR